MKNYILLFSLLLLGGCAEKKNLTLTDEDVLYQEEFFDTVFVSPEPELNTLNELPYYHAAFERKHDLIHTSLDIRFDWEKQHVIGKAILSLAPYFYPTNELVLDAKGFDLHKISKDGKDLSFDYTLDKIWIDLGREYKKDEKFVIEIDYTAKPNETPQGGSAAITSDKGLFFINPLNTEEKPQQIWTQGETENNSKWFPTIDKPNERCTQEIKLTVEDRFKTLSNGKMISSTKNTDGSRTDIWKQDQPHAPYLFMLAIGEYAVVEDIWKKLPLYYYVEPEFEKDAKNIFNHTPEMLSYFSDILDYPYPWDKYAQVVCRDYVSGAMENTGAVVFGEFVQKTTQELIDNSNDNIVAHEMFHHWFGDLVTCESWSNLTLNEGFANYSEYLWQEHKYGYYSAEHHRFNEMNAYLESSMTQGIHPLIHFHYDNKEEMFDAHSYNKGGLVLHMLRTIVGEDAFFQSLSKYLKDNAYTAVETDELRMAFEDVTGKDLNWFFDQWYFDQGHPILEVDYKFYPELNQMTATVNQMQDSPGQRRIFKLPVEIAIYQKDGSVIYHKAIIDKVHNEIILPMSTQPEAVVLDGKRDLLAIIQEERSIDELAFLFNHSEEFIDQFIAIKSLEGSEAFSQILDKALDHDYFYFRSLAVQDLDTEKDIDRLKTIVLNDQHSQVRKNALDKIYSMDFTLAESLSQKILNQEKSYDVIGKALDIIYETNPDNALAYVDEIAANNPKPLMGKISEIYAKTANPEYLGFFKKHLPNTSVYSYWDFVSQYLELAMNAKTNDIIETAEVLNQQIAQGDNIKKTILMYNMGRLAKNLSNDVGNSEAEKGASDIKTMMNEVINREKNQELIQQFRSYLD